MKTKTILILIVSLLLVLTGCTRKDVKDPDMNPGAGKNYNLSVTASPSTLYVPGTNPAVSSTINVRVTDYKGSPLSNGKVVFSHSGFGYFDSLQTSVQKTTNSSGVATATYYVPAGTPLTNEGTVNITTELISDGRIDSNLSPVRDIMPVKIIPYAGSSTLTISGQVSDTNGEGLEGAIIELSNNGGVAISRSSGSYEISVARGWSGTVTAKYNDQAINPTTGYTFTNLTQNVTNANFVRTAPSVVIVLSRSSITVPQDGSGEKDGVDGMVYYEVFARESTGLTGTWYTAKSDSSWLIVTGGALNDTPHHFHFKVSGPNTEVASRVGNIIVTPLSSKNGKPSGTPATLTVTQHGTGSVALTASQTTWAVTGFTTPGSPSVTIAIDSTNNNQYYNFTATSNDETTVSFASGSDLKATSGITPTTITLYARSTGSTSVVLTSPPLAPVTITVTIN